MQEKASAWALAASSLPLAFAQVREDPIVDMSVVERLGNNAQVAMVASGGCTVALLATCPNLTHIHLVDPNPAQIALCRLKMSLLEHFSPDQRLALLGHLPMIPEERETALKTQMRVLELAPNALGPMGFVGQCGPDYAGRYEVLFAQLQHALSDLYPDLQELLRLSDLNAQVQRIHPDTHLGQRLIEAFNSVMALPNLVVLFGEEATKNPIQSFGRHFLQRLHHVLATIPANCNPYLWQVLSNSYPPRSPAPWLSMPLQRKLPAVTWANCYMAEALRNAPASFDFIHLSNILDWLSPENARATLEIAWRALKPGGWILIRQLNSSLDIPFLGAFFDWQIEEAELLRQRDRSFFYRAIHLGRRKCA
jgi:S-adenosylmethionine-diacylglycerol 3-amino-3-carboxypropyl transferase